MTPIKISNEKYKNVPTSIPGEVINTFNGSLKNTFEIFIHSPFKDTLITASSEKDKNYSSIVIQARFKISSTETAFKHFVLLGGDADHYNWKEIYEKSKQHNNVDKLKWDLFLAPHHSSWTFFNDVPYGSTEDSKTPKETSLKVLDQKVGDGKIIASCKVIKNNDDNPPHYKAKEEYLKKVNKKEDFINLAIEPSKDAPEPLVFEFTSAGIVKQKNSKEKEEDEKKLAAAARIAGTSPIVKPWCNY
jgi:hypothetical protein